MTTITPSNVFTFRLSEAEVKHYQKAVYPPKTFHASSYVDCGRMQAYGLLGYEYDAQVVPQYKRDAWMGNWVHEFFQAIALASGYVRMVPNFDPDEKIRTAARARGELQPAIELPIKEFTVEPEVWQLVKRLRIGGRIDGELMRSSGLPMTWELKSVAEKYFSPKSKSYEGYFNDKLAHYESQCQLYMRLRGISEALVTIVSRERFFEFMRGNMAFDEIYQEHTVTYDPYFMEPELDRLERLATTVQVNELPEPEPSRGPCSFCNWKSICPNPARAG